MLNAGGGKRFSTYHEHVIQQSFGVRNFKTELCSQAC